MRIKHLLAAVALLLLGAGCPFKPAPTLEVPTAPPPSAERQEETSNAAAPAPYYIAYSPEAAAQAMKEGRPVVYYFWAVWCPICKAEEPKIKAWIEGSGLPIAGFRVNFDTESELKKQFKVPYQHTTIFLDKNGVEVDRNFGPVTEAEFLEDLKRVAQ